ncbi:isoaspartyl peptidase/L-asparaginase family protein [Methylovirgula sp. HY1]|uniref:isoaspartyl peptidase/L-asparaginase family protein n=1 Tax=Methylovirgula sp. HY1 TaxID=2822761 RepID=UPI001C5ACACA|nr:isoaspartyl peptidase/L-asparaginase family protein [Methylovirgula sp. HY1]QXX74348.1 Isoaspartyl peptidase [Methylovirgula sp. HY1]
MTEFSLMIHGGAGVIRAPENYDASLRHIIETGAALLDQGASALDAVTHCVALLEDDPLYNAGRGSVLNAQGIVDCDASIMDGRTLDAGAIAGVRGVKNPVLLARAVLEKSEHVFLIGEGAEIFAREHKISFEEADYFLTEHRVAQLARVKEKQSVALDHSQANDLKLGTVGAVARDRDGNLAAATSTGGLVNKQFGRVGDSAVIGAGTYADNASCAISCTGIGEHFLRTSLARTAAFFVEYQGMNAQEAADAAIRHLTQKIQGVGGLILIDRNGECGQAHSTPDMLSATAVKGEIWVGAGLTLSMWGAQAR